MEKIRCLTVFGTRLEAIKMAPLVKELQRFPDKIDNKVCVTAQHRDMLDQVLSIFQIEPEYDLNIMQPGQTLTQITSRALEKSEKVIVETKPHIVLVHGDTSTTFMAALAAFYQRITIGHVEAGLRTYDKYSPFPEEINRQLTGNIADLHFAPTWISANNLLKEGKKQQNIFMTGNTVLDAMKTTVRSNFNHPIFDNFGKNFRLIFMTVNSRENMGQPMENIFRAVLRIVDDHNDVVVVYPMHRNPAVRELAVRILGNHLRIHLIEPLDVIEAHNFMARSYLILTDSGRAQEEALSLGVPVLDLRNTTERPEEIKTRTLRLVGTNEEDIYNLSYGLLNHSFVYRTMTSVNNPYGDGHASERIREAVLYYFGLGERPGNFEG
ncbi:UDP-N-acetylglucosamine 2-epimerase (non-hydrolyzing) [Desulfosporosinus sp. BG]|uniref:non-hydrolyzing UDP-N-acetylglucosamine 2-epimerase n=1 Tax=Desulfosporosinus sp. BG TaxID=1633135 RepID=UPI00083A16A9|nr:UDP-N-acetylglucosamine 2-epimerase (non-hydrolyzing) [Desulfosporosinus sp. BG]ODA40983.1 UDP-N-acetylglucosamine 2-epimerase [Desulfosporosinus sp. BG]